MTKLQRIVELLTQNNLVDDLKTFSTDWAERDKSWCSFTMNKNRDMSIPTTINVLLNTRKRIRHYQAKQYTMGFIATDAIDVLQLIDNELSSYLLKEYKIETLAD